MGVWTREDYEIAYSKAIEYVKKHYPDNWKPGDYNYFVVWGDKWIELPYDEELSKEFIKRFKDHIEDTNIDVGYHFYESLFVKFK